MPRDVYVVEACRTPIGRYGGGLSTIRPDDLLGDLLASTVERCGITGSEVDEVVAGCANQAGEDNRNVARMALLLAGFPDTVPASTVNRLCGSSMDATHVGARTIAVGDAEVVIACGVESMSRAPLAMSKPERAFEAGHRKVWDTTLGWRFDNDRLRARFPLESMGETAENLVEEMSISREDQDRFALASHQHAVMAADDGAFDSQLVPVEIRGRRGAVHLVDQDEGPRRETDLDALGRLAAVFRDGGTVTAGNSSTLNDGAAALVLASEDAVHRFGFAPMARIRGMATAGVDPRYMGIGPVPASRTALERSGIGLEDIDVIELNEAFAAQAIAVLRELDIDADDRTLVNPNGGAIALGHPLGCSGARILTSLLHEMRGRGAARYGLATMCIGVGQGIATVVEATE